jgi:hypothetical protein
MLTALLLGGQNLLLVLGPWQSRFARARARPGGNDILFERFQFLVTISKRWPREDKNECCCDCYACGHLNLLLEVVSRSK